MISLNYRDARPIYEQIKNGLKRLIVTGALKEGDKLPSVRSIATELAINPNTIQKAYNELENEGYIYSVPGKGLLCQRRCPNGRAAQGRTETPLSGTWRRSCAIWARRSRADGIAEGRKGEQP